MKRLSGMLFLLIAALPYVAILFTGGEATDVEGVGETLIILSPHRREVRQEYSRAFSEWSAQHLGAPVHIRWLDTGGTAKMLKEIESRFAASPETSGADLMFGGGVAPFLMAVERGWLSRLRLSDELLAEIPPRCAGTPVYDPDHRWVGVALSGFGILYNTILIDRLSMPTPKTWEDLGNPVFFGWLGSGDPRSSGSVHMCYEVILQAYGVDKGWEIISRIAGNVRRFGEGGGTVPREALAGDIVAGAAIDQYAQTVIDAAGGNALAFVLPEQATVIGADSIGILKGAPHPELAQQFVDYVLSEEGQRLLFQPAGVNGQRHSLHRLPVRKALYDDPYAPRTRPYAYEEGMNYDTETAGNRWQLVNELIGTWLIDPHEDLVRAWKATIDAGLRADLVEKMSAPPITMEEMDEFSTAFNDSRKRLEISREWARQARQRYAEIVEEAGRTSYSSVTARTEERCRL